MGVWWQGADEQENVTGIVQPSGGQGGGSSGPQGGGPHGGFNVPDPEPTLATTQSGGYQPPGAWSSDFPEVTVGYGEGQVDPGLTSAYITQVNPSISTQQANQIAQEAMGSTGVGFGIGSLPPVAATTTDGTATPGPAEGTGLPEIVNENIIQPVIGGVGDFWNQYMSGSMLAAPWKMLKYPKAKQFTMYGNQNDLAIIKSLLLNAEGELDPTKVDIYYEKYKDIINEGLKTDMKEVEEERGGTTSDEFWDKKFEEQGNLYFKKALASAPDKGAQGEESQRRLDKVSFYEDQISPQTKGGLEKLAGETIITGENLSPEEKAFNQKVFNARNELDRQWGDQGGQGGGQGIADLSPVAQLAATTPEEVAAATVPAEVAAATTTPAATTTAMTTPTPFDYSQWPQYAATNQYPWPNYVNQGLGQWPNFDYWNQIANAFPGMSQYG